MSSLFLCLFTYAVLERLMELYLSRRNRRLLHERGFEQRERSLSLSLMVLLHVSWLVVTPLESLFDPAPLPVWLRLSAAVVFCLTQILRIWTLRTLGTYWNISVMTNTSGAHGFVSDGPYRFIRHPNYLVVILEIASLPLVGGAVASAVVFSLINATILAARIRTEERHLFQLPGYAANMGSKPRFLPRRA